MLKIIAFAAFLSAITMASPPLSAQTHAPITREANAEREFVALAGTYANAIVERDVATLDRLLSEDFIDVSPDGTVTTRVQFIAEYANPSATAPRFESAVFDTSNVQVRVYGDTALMTGRSTWRGHAGGHAFTGVLVSTMVAVHRDGQWQIASSHSSSVPPGQDASSPAE